MVTPKDNNRSSHSGNRFGTNDSVASPVDKAVLALARLLGRQAAREAFEAARTKAVAPYDHATPFPSSPTDTDTE